MEIEDFWIVIAVFCIAVAFFMMGFGISDFYCSREYSIYQALNSVDGLWLPNYNNTDNFICINVEHGDYEGMLEVCKHEVGHEIYNRNRKGLWNWKDSESFAEICESNFTECLEMIKSNKEVKNE